MADEIELGLAGQIPLDPQCMLIKRMLRFYLDQPGVFRQFALDEKCVDAVGFASDQHISLLPSHLRQRGD